MRLAASLDLPKLNAKPGRSFNIYAKACRVTFRQDFVEIFVGIGKRLGRLRHIRVPSSSSYFMAAAIQNLGGRDREPKSFPILGWLDLDRLFD